METDEKSPIDATVSTNENDFQDVATKKGKRKRPASQAMDVDDPVGAILNHTGKRPKTVSFFCIL